VPVWYPGRYYFITREGDWLAFPAFIWEVYKPGHQRKFGYYTLPVLWGDRLVARFDSKLDRTTNTFVVLGYWPENNSLGKNEIFAEALAASPGSSSSWTRIKWMRRQSPSRCCVSAQAD